MNPTDRPTTSRRRRRLSGKLPAATAAAAVGLALATVAGAPASAQDVEPARCTSRLPDDYVGGDVVVPDGRRCRLDEVAVDGDLHVGQRARLDLDRSALRGALTIDAWGDVYVYRSLVQGDVRVGPRAHFQPARSAVWGGLILDGAGHVSTGRVTIHRSVRGHAVGVVNFSDSTVKGNINIDFDTVADPVHPPALDLRGADVGGWVNTHGGGVHVAESRLARGLTASAALRVDLCSSSVTEDVTVRWAHGRTHIGHQAGSPIWPCDPSSGVEPTSTLGGSLVLVDNPHSIRVRGVVVAGDLVCSGNTGPLGVDTVHESVVVHGVRSGQCA